MSSNRAAKGLILTLITAVSVVSACGGATSEPALPAQEVEPTATAELVAPTSEPTEVPGEAPTALPTEVPAEAPTEAPTEAPREAPAQTPAAIGAEALLQERCTVCHTLDRVVRAGHSAVGWEQTVDRMVKRGAELDDGERAVLIEYLAETYGQ